MGTFHPGEDEEKPPPVPAIPESVNMAAARARAGARPKSLGLMSTPVRTASQKMVEGKGKGTWFGAAKVGDLGNMRTSDAIMTTAGLPTAQGQAQESDSRPGSRGSSVNFSYPGRARVASPTAPSPTVVEEEEGRGAIQPTLVEENRPKRRNSTISPQGGGSVGSSKPPSIISDQTLVYDPNSRRMVPRSELLALEQKIQVASEARPKKKKKSALSRAGSHLAKGTIGRSHGTAVENGVPNEATIAASASLKSHREQGKQGKQQMSQEPEETYEETNFESAPEASQPVPEEPADSAHIRHVGLSRSPASNAPEALPTTQTPTVHEREGMLHRMPSVVGEEDEDDESSAELEAPISTQPNDTAPAALDNVPIKHHIYTHGVPSPPQSDNTDDQPIEALHPAPVELAAALTWSPETATSAHDKQAAAKPRETQILQREFRTHSNSPVRSAHFGPVQQTLTVKHEPPSRSISPRKSALKQSSPSRGVSPAGDISDLGADASTQEVPIQRKKSVRVSFDDENTIVVGVAAGRSDTESPVPPSPQQMTARKPWYNTLGIGRKKGPVPLEEDEVMKPRPALPSFGSVRGRKSSPKPAEERPLVRPHDPASSPELEKMAGHNIPGQSSDQALGSFIHEHGFVNGTVKSNAGEPIPPVVTSIEGYGYVSDSASSDDESALLADTPKLGTEDSRVSQASTLITEPQAQKQAPSELVGSEHVAIQVKDFAIPSGAKPETVPFISVTQPSPHIEQKESEQLSPVHFPGSFPETETETDGETGAASPTVPTSQAQKENATSTEQTPRNTLVIQTKSPELDDNSDGSSIYSDAYEDLSDFEDHGFQSLDAVVEHRMISTPPKRTLEKALSQRTGVVTPTSQPHQSGSPNEDVTTQPADPWETAKAYWRSLTAEKRAQLEKEAAEEAAEEADLEGVDPEVKKPRRKKSMEQRIAEKKAIEQQKAATDPTRTYMIQPGTMAGSDDYDFSKKTALKGQQEQTVGGKNGVGSRLRKTMRSAAEVQPIDTGTPMRKSMRSAAPEKQQTSKQRPISHQPLGNTTQVMTGRHARSLSESTPTTSQGISSSIQPSLRRRGSDSSASSFRRSRPVSSGFGFRKTMRTGTGSLDLQEPNSNHQSTRLSLRSMSPGSRGASPPISMGSRMRTTLRGDTSQRRGSNENDSGKGYLRFSGSFGRQSEKKQQKQKRKSRFGDDSSDEDEVITQRFRSRFEDSSDEDVAPEPFSSLKPPKTMHSGAIKMSTPSPPLPEEEEMLAEEAGEKKQHITNGLATDPTLRRSRSGRALDGGQPASQRSGFMSVLRRSKKHDGGSKISRLEPRESAARRDTNLERSTQELSALRANSLHNGNTPSGPKLHKRFASLHATGEGSNSWPLNDDGAMEETKQAQEWDDDTMGDGEERGAATTSRGVLGHSKSQPSMNRPTVLASRTMSAQSHPDDGGNGERARKKKFGALRRMFRLDS